MTMRVPSAFQLSLYKKYVHMSTHCFMCQTIKLQLLRNSRALKPSWRLIHWRLNNCLFRNTAAFLIFPHPSSLHLISLELNLVNQTTLNTVYRLCDAVLWEKQFLPEVVLNESEQKGLFCSWSYITPSCIGTTSVRTTWTNLHPTTTAPERRSSTVRRGRAKTPSMLWWRSASTATASNQSGWLSIGYSTTGGHSQWHNYI